MVEGFWGYFCIGDILEKYSNIFLDTNIFLGITIDLNKTKREDYHKICEIREKLLEFWIPLLKKENSRFYISQNIFLELKKDHFNYKKALKNNPPFGKEYLENMRIRKRLKNERNSFLDEFPLERIVDRSTLEEKVLYDELYEKYNYFLKFSEKIGKEDFDLLLLSGIFSKSKGKTCLISNDFGILNCYNHFLINEGLFRNNFGFYYQQGLNLFKRG
jgi:hypothetical protein